MLQKFPKIKWAKKTPKTPTLYTPYNSPASIQNPASNQVMYLSLLKQEQLSTD